MSSTEHRKLAAIMFTDMVGYSALAQRNEALALELLEEHRSLLRGLFPQHQGTEIKTTGDGFLVEFASALAAVRCAIEIQRSLATRNLASPPDRQLQVRIGVHVGDVVHHEGDVLGDGVNIASRIEPLAGPGGICLSVDVERQIRNVIEIPLIKLGHTELKNIKLPMELYRVLLPWQQQAAVPPRTPTSPQSRTRAPVLALAMALVLLLAGSAFLLFSRPKEATSTGELAEKKVPRLAALEKTRILVLPLETRGKEDSAVGFAGGMSEALRGQLSLISGLRVIDGTLLGNAQGTPSELRHRCRELNAGSLLRGSVQQIGGRLRVHLELLNSETAEVLWPYEDNREFKDIFAMQSDVAQGVAAAVRVQLLPAEKQQLERKPTQNVEAYDLYLQARELWNRRTAGSLVKAIDYFDRAIEKDPRFALAYAGLADCYVLGGYAGLPPRETMPKAREAAQRAIDLDNTLAEPHASLARIKGVFDWDWPGAEAEFRQAIKLNPNYATAHHWFSDILSYLGRFDEAVVEIKRAQQINPLSLIINTLVGEKLSWAGHSEAGIEVLRKQIALNPGFTMAHIKLAAIYLRNGMLSDAITDLEPMQAQENSGTYVLDTLGLAYARAGKTNNAENVLNQLLELQRQGRDHRVTIALIQHLLGHDTRAMDSLEEALKERADGLESLLIEPFWKDLRPNPRFQAILKHMNLAK